MKDLVFFDCRDIFHCNDIRGYAFDKTSKMVKKPPSPGYAVGLITLSIGGEWLAGGAACQNRHASIPEQFLYILRLDLTNVPLKKTCFAVVFLIRETTGRIKIYSCDDGKSLQDKPVCQSTRATK